MGGMAEVIVTDNPALHRFEADLDGELAGIAQYQLADGVITFVHTEVHDAFEGHGVGSALARTALESVRRDGSLRVVVTCPFITEWMQRHPGYEDLLVHNPG